MDVFTIFRWISPHFRRRRMKAFIDQLKPGKNDRILDVGGYPEFWTGSGIRSFVTILNVHLTTSASNEKISTVVGDATDLQYEDNAFDIVFSNSVLEHLGTLERQQRLANECARVGKRLWIQTPARSFPIEPHFLTPFIHYLPKSWRKKMLRNCTVWGWLVRPSDTQIDDALDEIRLLNDKEMRVLFPDCTIEREKVFGLTKSYIAVRNEPRKDTKGHE
jgi:Methyltransferase domain